MNEILNVVVKEALEQNKATRGDDFKLILEVFRKLRFLVPDMTFENVMEQHSELKLPSFESITRCRRSLQKDYEELRPTESVRVVRRKEEEKYREMYS